MKPITKMNSLICRSIQMIFTDIDDTLTIDGKIPESAFSAIWRAHEAGLQIVPVTGRPAGWCDHIARMWPVGAVVGENGALCFSMRRGKMVRLFSEQSADASKKLEDIKNQVLAEVPGCKVAADQAYREYDLAIDFCEEVAPLENEAVTRIHEIFLAHGATAKISSIHVNGWFGDFDKFTMCRRYCEEILGSKLDVERSVYAGDSPNDEPMFAEFPHSCGVANILHFTSRMSSLPAYVTPSPGGRGFSELIAHILSHR